MAYETVSVRQVVRRMRGGSQAFLIEGDDDRFYVAKFAGNPQGNRTLINEWAAHRVLQQLDISTPDMRVLRLTSSTRGRELLSFQTGGRNTPIQGEFHLGSLCPVNPTTAAVYDFLPAKLLSKVVNLNDLGSAFVIDKWFGQTDTRQAIFVRERGSNSNLKLHLYVIDHGMSFNGDEWAVRDSAGSGLYMDRRVYPLLDMEAVCEKTVSEVSALSEADLYRAIEDVPSCWFAKKDGGALAKLFDSLELRRKRLSSVISRHLDDLLGRSPANPPVDSGLDFVKGVVPQPREVLTGAVC